MKEKLKFSSGLCYNFIFVCLFVFFNMTFAKTAPHMHKRANLQCFRPVKSVECCCYCSYCPRSTSLPLNPSRISTTKQQLGPTPTTSSNSVPKGSTASLIQGPLSARSHKTSPARSRALHLWHWLGRTLPAVSQKSPLLIKTTISHILVE